jgi:fumarylacetoacetase
MKLDETHDPALESWVESANERYAEFPIQNLPFGRFRRSGGPPRIGVAIGDQVFEIEETSLNALAARGRRAATELRLELSRQLRRGNPNPPLDRLHPMSECEMLLPFDIGDYTDFYASIHHATSVGKMMRPDNPLLPNYKWVPIGLPRTRIVGGRQRHARSSTQRSTPARFRCPRLRPVAPARLRM